uniref:Ammonium_transp domain-containing protein n=1 Tax=Macrostomum lignano TaxID=282301 RepID=A0A1I8FP36_9PLAT
SCARLRLSLTYDVTGDPSSAAARDFEPRQRGSNDGIRNAKFGAVALALQALFVVALFAAFAKYDEQADAGLWGNATGRLRPAEVALRTAWDRTTRWYGFCSVGLKHAHLSALVIQLLAADFACAAVLISFGAMLGRLSPLQCLVLSLVEIPIFVANEYVGLYIFKAATWAAAMFVHVFGAYFGIAASKALTAPGDGKNSNDHSGYSSDLFAMIAFNAGLASGDDKHRAVINTYLSLAALHRRGLRRLRPLREGKFEMSHIQNATLAGGVAVGTVADMMIRPYGALIIGCLPAPAQRVWLRVIAKKLARRQHPGHVRVNNLHGMPGLLAGLLGIIYSASASLDDYGNGSTRFFRPRRQSRPTAAPSNTWRRRRPLRRSQAAFQAAALGLTLLCAVLGGLLTGFILRLPILDPVRMENFFQDDRFWHVPSNYDAQAIRREGSVPLKRQGG